MMRLSQLCEAANGVLHGADRLVDGISINTREDCHGKLFVALNGERFDAHEFIADAIGGGAAAVMCEQDNPVPLPDSVEQIARLEVRDSHQALKDMAGWWRDQFAIPVIGITGSVGKTTVKEMLGAILAEVGETLVTAGNLNNEIGVPLTLFRLNQAHRFAVIEMGMNHAGEIQRLSTLARPSIALVNNAAAAHLEGLGSIAAVADAKGEIFAGLGPDGVAIINHDDEFAPRWRELASAHRILEFGLTPGADISASYELARDSLDLQVQTPDGEFDLTLNLPGRHNVMNVLAAVAAAYAANISMTAIAAGLAGYQPAQARLNVQQIGQCTLIDDTYNANPASMQAAIEVLARYPQSLLVVGDMAELGEASQTEHLRLGEVASKAGITQMLACGEYADDAVARFAGSKHSFTTRDQLIDWLQESELSHDAILVKGSRSAAMEVVVAALQQKMRDNTPNLRRKI